MIQRFESFVTGITFCYKHIQKIKNEEMTEFDLKGAHVMCLFFLNHNPDGLTAAELCRLCAEDKAAISRTISSLQQRGYIEPGEKKYRAPLHLTEKGKEMAKYVDGKIEQWVAICGKGLSDRDRETFYRVLDTVTENLRSSACCNFENEKL